MDPIFLKNSCRTCGTRGCGNFLLQQLLLGGEACGVEDVCERERTRFFVVIGAGPLHARNCHRQKGSLVVMASTHRSQLNVFFLFSGH